MFGRSVGDRQASQQKAVKLMTLIGQHRTLTVLFLFALAVMKIQYFAACGQISSVNLFSQVELVSVIECRERVLRCSGDRAAGVRFVLILASVPFRIMVLSVECRAESDNKIHKLLQVWA